MTKQLFKLLPKFNILLDILHCFGLQDLQGRYTSPRVACAWDDQHIHE